MELFDGHTSKLVLLVFVVALIVSTAKWMVRLSKRKGCEELNCSPASQDCDGKFFGFQATTTSTTQTPIISRLWENSDSLSAVISNT